MPLFLKAPSPPLQLMLRLLVPSLCLACQLGTASAEGAAAASRDLWQDKPLLLPAKQLDIRSESNGRLYRIYLHIPTSPPPAEGFPILYLLDGNATFPLATLLQDTMLERASAFGITPGIIVGIGYPVDTKLAPAYRTEDYTPPAPDLSSTGDTSGHPQGGADRFLSFIEDELKPRLARDFKIDSKRQTLFGHSYGGLFTLHTLFTRPGSFQRYFAASPSIWWNERHILTEKDVFLKQKPPAVEGARLRLTVGSLEQTPPPGQQASQRSELVTSRRQVDNAKELTAELRASGLDAGFLLFENENHGSARVPAINQALRFAFAISPQ